MAETNKKFRVLCIDGGGMRGIYTAAYLSGLSNRFAVQRQVEKLDIGKAFDLIVGTSTGAIIACSLAIGIEPRQMCDLYYTHGKSIFPEKLPNSFTPGDLYKVFNWPKFIEAGDKALRTALEAEFGTWTMADVYNKRGIALSIPATEMSRHHSWVFKTQHVPKSFGRDNDYTLVEVCMASSAAPIYRSMAHINNPNELGSRVFVDGGLWANSPILVGLIDALKVTSPDQDIELYSLGTCPRPAGEQISEHEAHRSLKAWKFGGNAVALSLDAQEFATHHMVRMLLPHLDRQCEILRFPTGKVPADVMEYLELDETRKKGLDALVSQANRDVDETLSRCGDVHDEDGQRLNALFEEMPVMETKEKSLTL